MDIIEYWQNEAEELGTRVYELEAEIAAMQAVIQAAVFVVQYRGTSDLECAIDDLNKALADYDTIEKRRTTAKGQ
jgi:hypothetical protein